jgi:hypothetical protein
MKTTIVIITAIILSSCGKDKLVKEVEQNNSTVESVISAYDHDVLVKHSSFSYFATEGTMSNISLIGKENGVQSNDVDLGNFYFDNSLVEINGKKSYSVSETELPDFDKFIGKTVDFGYDGNPELGFEPFKDKISIVSALKSDVVPKNSAINLKKPEYIIRWNAGNADDDIVIYVKWHGDRNIQVPKLWTKIIKDNGSYAIPNSVYKDYPTEGKIQIKLVRFEYESKKIGDKKVLIVSTSTLESLFPIIKTEN